MNKIPRFDPETALYGEYVGMQRDDEFGDWCSFDDVEKLETDLSEAITLLQNAVAFVNYGGNWQLENKIENWLTQRGQRE